MFKLKSQPRLQPDDSMLIKWQLIEFVEEQIVSNISEEVEEEVDGLFEDWFSVEKRRKSILCLLPTLFWVWQ